MTKIEIYRCDHCNVIFGSWRECYDHEKTCTENKCAICAHAYTVCGEFRCAKENEGKRCRFKEQSK